MESGVRCGWVVRCTHYRSVKDRGGRCSTSAAAGACEAVEHVRTMAALLLLLCSMVSACTLVPRHCLSSPQLSPADLDTHSRAY